MVRLRWGTGLLLAIFLAAMMAPSTGAQSNTTILITDVDSGEFPAVWVGFRAVDSSGNPIAGLDANDVDVYENDQPVDNFQIGQAIDGPVHVTFVVDLGQQNGTMSAATRRQTLVQYANEHFRDGIDSASVILLDNNGTGTVVAGPTTSRDALVQGINGANLASDRELATRGLMGVESAIESLSNELDPNQTGTAVVYLTDSIFATRPSFGSIEADARDLSATAQERHIPVFVLQTDDDNTAPLDTLVDGTGGTRITLTDNASGNQGNLSQLFNQIHARGLAYQGSYRSTSGAATDRRVTILPTGTPLPGPAESSAGYSVSLTAPDLVITTPTNGEAFTRTGSRENGSVTYDPNRIDVTAEIADWPDGHPRLVESAELLVDGVSKLRIQPEPRATQFTFLWDISDLRAEGTNTRTIQIRVVDELGLEGNSPTSTVQINVIPPPPPPTAVPPAVEPGTIPSVVIADPCEESQTSQECIVQRLRVYGPWVLLTVLAIAFLFMLRRLNEAIAMARQGGGTIRQQVAEVRKTLLGGSPQSKVEVLGKLHVITARPDLIDQIIDLDSSKKTIGRDPRLADIQLYNESDASSVSGLHCTIQYDRLRNVFLLTDNNSSNGTTINNATIAPDDPTELHDGDVIVLGHLFKQGAKLRLEVVASAAVVDSEPWNIVPAGNQGGSSTATELGDRDEFVSNLFGDDAFGMGTETLVDTDVDVIDIVPPAPSDRVDKKDDRSWLDDLE